MKLKMTWNTFVVVSWRIKVCLSFKVINMAAVKMSPEVSVGATFYEQA